MVGLGSIGRRHLANLRALRPEAELWALRRTGGDRPDPGVKVVRAMDEALALEPAFAVVASPAPFHVADAMALAVAGVHLLVEKPIAHALEGVRDLIDLCRAHSLVLMTGYSLRFSPALKAMREALDRGRIGRVLGFRAEVGQYLPDWRPGTDYRQGVTARAELGGGAVLELSHEFDYLRLLLGEAEEVCAWTATRGDLDLDVEDWAEALIRFQDGVLGSVHLDLLQRAPVRSCRIVGSEGTLVWDGLADTASLFRPSPGWTELAAGGADRNQLYLDELAHFLDCVRTGAAPAVTGEDGLRALELALAVKASARDGRTVTLPWRNPCEP
ncbi:MAG: Gfo/Idh/MocA family oxidoreductase [Holophaga sp.]